MTYELWTPDWVTAQPYAHRGVISSDAVGNTLAAFDTSAASGLGIKLDVQIGADNSVFVYHNSTVPDGRQVTDLTSSDAHATKLADDSHIPTLNEALDVIGGRVPLLVNLKAQPTPIGKLEHHVVQLLTAYQGPAAVVAFDPRQLAWFASTAPHIPRGQTSGWQKPEGWLEQRQLDAANSLAAAGLSQPQMVLRNLTMLPDPAVCALRQTGVPVLGWTAYTRQQMQDSLRHVDQHIISGFTPPAQTFPAD